MSEPIFDALRVDGADFYAYPDYAHGEEIDEPVGLPIELPCPCFVEINGHLGRLWRGEPCERHWCDARGKEIA